MIIIKHFVTQPTITVQIICNCKRSKALNTIAKIGFRKSPASSKICKIKTKDAEQASNIIPFAFAEQGRKQTRYHQLFKYVVLSIIIKNQPLAICIVNEHQSSKILKF